MNARRKNWLEWTVFWISLTLIVAVAGLLVYLALSGGRRDPLLEVTLGPPERVPTGYAVPVTVTNTGTLTAEGVVVEVRAGETGSDERGELTIAFVPGGSRRYGWVTFSREPAADRLRARLIGYEKP